MENDFLLLNLGILKFGYLTSPKLLHLWIDIERKLKIDVARLVYQTEDWKQLIQYLREKQFPAKLINYIITFPLWKEEITFVNRFISSFGIKVVSWWDKKYPLQLKYINDPPLFLFIKGDVNDLSSVASMYSFVGTRTPTSTGEIIAKRFMWEASLIGIITVSGFAQGIDTIIFAESQRFHNKTVAVLPFLANAGIERWLQSYDKNIILLSEYLIGPINNRKWMYVERNRIIAALSTGVIVVEAPPHSGSLITADFGYSYHRAVFYAAQAIDNFIGYGGVSHALQYNEGRFIRSLADVLEETDKQRYDMLIKNVIISILELFFRNTGTHFRGVLRDPTDLLNAWNKKDITKVVWSVCHKQINLFTTVVIELKRLNIINEYKGKLLINFLFSPQYAQKFNDR